MLVSVQEAAILSRAYEQHHYPGPALVSCKCLMCTDQESDVFHRLFSVVLLEPAASCMHGYKNGLFDGFSGFLPGYLSVPHGHFYGLFCSSLDAPSTGIPIDTWC